MYFVGNGKAAWKVKAETNYVSDQYTKQYTAFTEKFAITINEKKIDKISSYIA